MSTFTVQVLELTILPHENADALELAKIGDYLSVVRKGQFKTGDLGVYIPEQSIVPADILASMNLTGKLAGSTHDRVKAARLRGILSQGLVYPVVDNTVTRGDNSISVKIGDDVADFLGITKYEPPIPTCLAGEVFNASGHTLKFDIENYKRFPNVIQDGEEVVFTEKIHGTFCIMGHSPSLNHPDTLNGSVVVSSKGMSAQGLALKFNEANKNNTYIKAFHGVVSKTASFYNNVMECTNGPIFFLGEVFGKGIQDLGYGTNTPEFRLFDIYIGRPNQGRYLDFDEKVAFANTFGITMVPVIYRGPFSKEIMIEHTSGNTMVGDVKQIREGLVVTPIKERSDMALGRVILKSVSDDYLLRKNATEFN